MMKLNVFINVRGPNVQNPTEPRTTSMLTLRWKSKAQRGNLQVSIAPFDLLLTREDPAHTTGLLLQSSKSCENSGGRPRRKKVARPPQSILTQREQSSTARGEPPLSDFRRYARPHFRPREEGDRFETFRNYILSCFEYTPSAQGQSTGLDGPVRGERSRPFAGSTEF